MASHKHPPELRPYRVAMYVVAGVAVLWFIGCIIWSVHAGTSAPAPAGEEARPSSSVAACADELDGLYRELAVRASEAFAGGPAAWSEFNAAYERKAVRFEARCTKAAPSDATPDFHPALHEASVALDGLRAHLARCGGEGEESRAGVVGAIARVRAATIPAH